MNKTMHFTLKNYISCTNYCIFFDNILSYYTLLVMSSKRKYFSCTPLIKNLRNKNSNILTNLSPCMTIVFSASTKGTPLLCVSSLEKQTLPRVCFLLQFNTFCLKLPDGCMRSRSFFLSNTVCSTNISCRPMRQEQ